MRQTHIIIGAGQAGGWAAVAMRQAGFAGRILLIGEEPWRPYERPPLSKAMLTEEPAPPGAVFPPGSEIRRAGHRTAAGRRRWRHSIRPRIGSACADGRALDYDRLLLATGGRARRLAVPGGEHALTLRTLEDARAIRARLAAARRVVCIGAGVIGLEIAASARTRGAAVTVLEALARRDGPRGLARGRALHRDGCIATPGCRLRFDVAVDRIEAATATRSSCCAATGRHSRPTWWSPASACSATWRWRSRRGLAIEGGIVVDELGRTSAPDIFAAGDVAAFLHPLFGRRLRLESWRHAQNHGIAVGKAMCGDTTPYDDVPWFWTDQHGVNLQVAGLPAEAARTIVRADVPPEAFIAVHLAEDDSVIGVTAANAPREIRAGQALIKSGKPVDISRIADATVPLQQLIPR